MNDLPPRRASCGHGLALQIALMALDRKRTALLSQQGVQRALCIRAVVGLALSPRNLHQGVENPEQASHVRTRVPA
jgi:intracellular sulfur oxidation DsrE/DsrF family protein